MEESDGGSDVDLGWTRFTIDVLDEPFGKALGIVSVSGFSKMVDKIVSRQSMTIRCRKKLTMGC